VVRAGQTARPNVRGKSIDAVIRECDRFIDVIERRCREHRPEYLLTGYFRLFGDVAKDGRREVMTRFRHGHFGPSTFDSRRGSTGDKALHLFVVTGADQGA
jgi:hypothetical protein